MNKYFIKIKRIGHPKYRRSPPLLMAMEVVAGLMRMGWELQTRCVLQV